VTGRTLRLVLFIVVAVIQLAVAAGAIIRSEAALRTGETFRFKLQPVDPVDAFRGRYVALGFVEDHAPLPDGLTQLNQRKVWVPLVNDSDGFANFGPVVVDRPESGAYLRLRSGVEYVDDDGRRVVSLALPFRRYYMTEDLAREVDRSLWRRGQRRAWVTVKVRAGAGVIEELWVEGVPVREWLASGGPERPPAEVTDGSSP
jgi:uncharacterized membrane-anchored protein